MPSAAALLAVSKPCIAPNPKPASPPPPSAMAVPPNKLESPTFPIGFPLIPKISLIKPGACLIKTRIPKITNIKAIPA